MKQILQSVTVTDFYTSPAKGSHVNDMHNINLYSQEPNT